ncbi:MAG: hypothetical protein ACK47U_09580 [Verrucomicrobiota bacterium]|jgi:hypothetical protein
MEAFIRSNKAVWWMLIADLLAVVGWFIVKLNGGTELNFPLFGLSGLLFWNVLFFWSRSQLNAKS